MPLNLAAKAGLGRCDEARYRLAALETEASLAYPPELDPDVPPRPHRNEEVRALRENVAAIRRAAERWKVVLADGSFDRAPELEDLAPADRRNMVEKTIETLRAEIAAADEILIDPDDARVAQAWSRRDEVRWQESVGIVPGASVYDLAGKAERLSIQVRSAIGRCLLAAGRATEAAEILSPCAGNGPKYHSQCDEPLVKAGLTLVAQNRVKEAAAVYRRVVGIQNLGMQLDELFAAIDRSAPGSVPRRPTPAPVPPVRIPEP